MRLRIFSFIKFYFKANSKYAIHSPFVYDFIESVLESNKNFYSYLPIECLRNQLKANKDVIRVNDLGAGSKAIKSNNRKVSQIAKHSIQNRKTAQLLFRLIDHYKCKSIIELGTSLGVTTAYLASASKNGQVYTLEGCSATLQVAKRGTRVRVGPDGMFR